jgi:hypothetical protein
MLADENSDLSEVWTTVAAAIRQIRIQCTGRLTALPLCSLRGVRMGARHRRGLLFAQEPGSRCCVDRSEHPQADHLDSSQAHLGEAPDSPGAGLFPLTAERMNGPKVDRAKAIGVRFGGRG